MIEGRLQLDRWEDKETGKNRSKLKVVGELLQLLGGRSDGDSGGSQASRPQTGQQETRTPDAAFYDAPSTGDGDVPF